MEICNPKMTMMMMMINNNKDRTHVDHRLQQFVENRSQIQEDSSTVVEAGSLKSRCPQGHTSSAGSMDNLFLFCLVFSSPFQFLLAPGIAWPALHPSNLWFPGQQPLPPSGHVLCISLLKPSLPLSYKDTRHF